MWLFFTWIPTLLTILFLIYSKIGNKAVGYVKRTLKWLLYDSTKPRRWVWTRYYELVSWLYPDDSYYISNSGYALLSEDGQMNKFTPLKHERKEIFQYQLYYTVANMVEKEAISGKKIIDLSCGRGGGAFFLYSMYKPKKIFGIDVSYYNIRSCREVFVNNDLRAIIRKRQTLRKSLAKKLSVREVDLKDMEQFNRNRINSMSVLTPNDVSEICLDTSNNKKSNTPA